MAEALNNGMDIIDSRDVIARIAELNANESLEDDEKSELLALEELQDAVRAGSDWEDGVALIRDSYFEQYARTSAEELGGMPDAVSWPFYHIDWKAAAESLLQDYSQADFDGETYWYST
jgi:hypothetical protein